MKKLTKRFLSAILCSTQLLTLATPVYAINQTSSQTQVDLEIRSNTLSETPEISSAADIDVDAIKTLVDLVSDMEEIYELTVFRKVTYFLIPN